MTDYNRNGETGTQPTVPLPRTDQQETRPIDPASLPRPRIRFGAIVWGLIVCVLAATVFWISTDESRREAFGNWISSLTPGTSGLIVMLILGTLLLIWGGLAAIRRSQERGTTPRL